MNALRWRPQFGRHGGPLRNARRFRANKAPRRKQRALCCRRAASVLLLGLERPAPVQNTDRIWRHKGWRIRQRIQNSRVCPNGGSARASTLSRARRFVVVRACEALDNLN